MKGVNGSGEGGGDGMNKGKETKGEVVKWEKLGVGVE